MRALFAYQYSVMAKILTIVSVSVLFVAAASGVGIYKIRALNKELQIVAEADVPLTEALAHVTAHRLEQSQLIERLLRLQTLHGDHEDGHVEEAETRFFELAQQIKGEFDDAISIANHALSIAQTRAQAAEFRRALTTLTEIREEHIRYSATSQKALKLAHMGQLHDAEELLHEIEDVHVASDRQLGDLLFRIQGLARSAAQTAFALETDAIRITAAILLASVVLSFLLAIWIGRHSIAWPLTEVVNALYRLSRSDFGAELPTDRKDEIGDIGRAFNVFKEQMLALQAQEKHENLRQQALNREIKLLSELNEWLQSSNSLDELFKMVSRFMGMLLPDCSGALYVYSNSRDVLDGACSWNGARLDAHIRPDTCWGLRRGRTYVYGDSVVSFACDHVEAHDEASYICVPILAHGETVGLMHLTPAENVRSAVFLKQRKLAQMAAEQISLAIANTRMRDELHSQSIRDPLTGLYNRRHFTDTLRKNINSSSHDGHPVSLVSIDVDHFKKFNDNHGHDAGDMVLRAVGTVLQEACDGEQLPCRLGGEEFMALLPRTSQDAAVKIAEKLRRAVEAISVRYGEKTLPHITISLGVATYPKHGSMPVELMKSADDALYASKAGGRNRVTIATLADDTPPVSDPDLEAFNADGAGELAVLGPGASAGQKTETAERAGKSKSNVSGKNAA